MERHSRSSKFESILLQANVHTRIAQAKVSKRRLPSDWSHTKLISQAEEPKRAFLWDMPRQEGLTDKFQTMVATRRNSRCISPAKVPRGSCQAARPSFKCSVHMPTCASPSAHFKARMPKRQLDGGGLASWGDSGLLRRDGGWPQAI